MTERWLTVSEAAERLRVGNVTVQRWLRAGKLPGTLLSRRAGWRIPERAVDALLQGEHAPSAPSDAREPRSRGSPHQDR
jgi:excisionase family DNA binding protein